MDLEIAKAVDAAIEVLRKLAPVVSEVALPAVEISMDEIYTRVRSVEAYTYHSRWIAESPEKYQPSTRDRVQNGAKIKAEDYVQARRDIDLLRREIKETFANVDLLITPTLPTPPVPITQGADPTAVRYRNTVPFDILGLPAIPFRVASHRPAYPLASRSLAPRSLSQPSSPVRRLTSARPNGTKDVRS